MTTACKMLHDPVMDRQELGASRDDPQPGRLRDSEELAAFLGIPVETVITWRHRKKGPPFLRVGRHVRYDLAEVHEWLASRRNLPRGVA